MPEGPTSGVRQVSSLRVADYLAAHVWWLAFLSLVSLCFFWSQKECLRTTPQGAERLGRRNEVIIEALAEEVQRGEQRKKRSNKATAAVPESESAAPERERSSG